MMSGTGSPDMKAGCQNSLTIHRVLHRYEYDSKITRKHGTDIL